MVQFSQTTKLQLLRIISNFEKLKKSEEKGEIEIKDVRTHVKKAAQSALSFAKAVGDLSSCGTDRTRTRLIKREIEQHVLESLKGFLADLKRYVKICDTFYSTTRDHFRNIQSEASDLAEESKGREKSARNKKHWIVIGGVAGTATAAAIGGAVIVGFLTGGVGAAPAALAAAGCVAAGGITVVTAAALYDIFSDVEERARELVDVLDNMGSASSQVLSLINQIDETVTHIETKRGVVEHAETMQRFRNLAETFGTLCKVFNDQGTAIDQAIQQLREINEKISDF